ncbi:MAG: hypothetical protein F6K65_43660, partial [Moorea sp. SIO3C2]|nr:hypothetical protein [Moorena sp. SIO3C2]
SKTYLEEHDLAKYAKVWILNLVEFVHWILLVPSFYLSYIIFEHTDTLTQVLGDSLQVYLLSVAPLIQAFAGLVAVVMHEYEGWQVVFFKNPVNQDFRIQDVNNAWLREIAYKMLFLLQIVGLLAFSMGAIGVSKTFVVFAISSIILAFLSPQQYKTEFKMFGQPLFPIAIPIVVIFIINALINLYAYYVLFSPVLGTHHYPGLLALAAPVLFMAGGIIEGVFAESTFNQWVHFWAVILLNLGLIVQIYTFGLFW